MRQKRQHDKQLQQQLWQIMRQGYLTSKDFKLMFKALKRLNKGQSNYLSIKGIIEQYLEKMLNRVLSVNINNYNEMKQVIDYKLILVSRLAKKYLSVGYYYRFFKQNLETSKRLFEKNNNKNNLLSATFNNLFNIDDIIIDDDIIEQKENFINDYIEEYFTLD